MAALSSGKQGVGVYLVWPLSSAALATSLMKAGVSKSGSPAPKPTTSTPAFLRALALALTARVMDSDTSFIRWARGIMSSPVLLSEGEKRYRRGVDWSTGDGGEEWEEQGLRI